MAEFDRGTTETDSLLSMSGTRRAVGVAALAVAVAATLVWLSWRIAHLGAHPVEIVICLFEIIGLVIGVGVAAGLMSSGRPRSVFENDPRESYRFAFAVADHVGRTRSVDLHRDVRVALRSAPHVRTRSMADIAIGSVLLEGPRRLGLVAALTVALLLGVSPMPLPPNWAIAAGVLGAVAFSCSHVALGRGRIRVGDRIRWSYSSLGEVLARTDRDGLAPRRWVGTVATVVVVNLAVALRGMSDRWTHGLPPMTGEDRFITMMLAITVVAGGLFTLRTMTAPQLADAHLVSRRLEERTARQSALGGAVCIGLVGLLAGVLPGSVDAADDDPTRVEHVVDDERVPAIVDLDVWSPDG